MKKRSAIEGSLFGWFLGISLMLMMLSASALSTAASGAPDVTRFAQLGTTLPTPNVYRTASGAPGHAYWQQRADYQIEATLDESKQKISAQQTITYSNNSPDTLPYLWLQLDQNRFRRDSLEERSRTGGKADDGVSDQLSFGTLRRHQSKRDVDYGFTILKLTDGDDVALAHTLVGTMMRIDLPRPMAPGTQQVLNIEWQFNILK